MFFEFINKFMQIYLNDIFIYNKSKIEYKRHLKQIFVKLKKHELQIDVNKYEFFQIEIKFLKNFLLINDLRINSIKIAIIVD